MTAPADEQRECLCDCAAYESLERPFLVHPDCPRHAARSRYGDGERGAIPRRTERPASTAPDAPPPGKAGTSTGHAPDDAVERAEVERLSRWKREAMEVLDQWEAVWQALGRPGRFGGRKSAAVLAEVKRLSAAVEAVRALADEWEAGQALNRDALSQRVLMPYSPPGPDDLRRALDGTGAASAPDGTVTP